MLQHLQRLIAIKRHGEARHRPIRHAVKHRLPKELHHLRHDRLFRPIASRLQRREHIFDHVRVGPALHVPYVVDELERLDGRVMDIDRHRHHLRDDGLDTRVLEYIETLL